MKKAKKNKNKNKIEKEKTKASALLGALIAKNFVKPGCQGSAFRSFGAPFSSEKKSQLDFGLGPHY